MNLYDDLIKQLSSEADDYQELGENGLEESRRFGLLLRRAAKALEYQCKSKDLLAAVCRRQVAKVKIYKKERDELKDRLDRINKTGEYAEEIVRWNPTDPDWEPPI